MIHVIIPIHNRLNLSINCLNSLTKLINYNELNIIIVDDGSTDGSRHILKKKFPEVTIINGTGSLYWCGSVNLGVKYVLKISKPNDWVLLVNNDVEIFNDALIKLIEVSKSSNRKAIVSSLTVSADDKKTVLKTGTLVKSWFLNKTEHLFKDTNIDKILNKNPVHVHFLTARCLLHPVEIFSFAGNYDNSTFPHYGGDDEFSMRIKKFGYSTILCPSSIVFLRSNEKVLLKKNLFKNFFYVFFSIKSSSNIINKFRLTMKVIPLYAKLTFFIIGIIKSFFIFCNKTNQNKIKTDNFNCNL